MTIADLETCSVTRTCKLRKPPSRAPQGRRSRLDPDLVRRVRYDYWLRGVSLATCTAALGVTEAAAYRILTFQRLASV